MHADVCKPSDIQDVGTVFKYGPAHHGQGRGMGSQMVQNRKGNWRGSFNLEMVSVWTMQEELILYISPPQKIIM